MCGIFGQLNRDGKPVAISLLKKMQHSLTHRGPDEQNLFTDKTMGLGNCRLALIDIPKGHQPLANESKNLWITFNGEIYNYIELREKLTKQGFHFRTQSDTEVILHLYEAYKEKCVHHLEGMFAFAIWDREAQQLFLARDRFGIKPLFYYEDAKTFLFASEIKALRHYHHFNDEINLKALHQYFTFLYNAEPSSIFEAVKKIPPGHYLKTDGVNAAHLECYWHPFAAKLPRQTDRPAAQRIYRELQASVKRSLRSDVPVGVFLSGGIDSSAITAFASRLQNKTRTFSIVFEEALFSEKAYSRLIADKFNTDHTEILLRPDEAATAAEEMILTLDEPFADASALPAYVLSRAASKSVKAVLSGEGGDELFAGYSWQKHKKVKSVSLSRWFTDIIFDRPTLKATLSSRTFKSLPVNAFKIPKNDLALLAKLSPLHQSLYIGIKYYLSSDLLVKMDRFPMRHSLEVRVPFLNHPFAEMVLNLPASLKLKQGQRKYILKEALKKILPAPILNRKKMGFSIPLDIWLWQKGKFRDMVGDTLTSQAARKRGLFQYRAIQKMLREQHTLEQLHGYRLWTLFVLESWFQRMKL